MQDVSKELSCRLSNLGFLFAMVVVFIHVPSARTSGVVFLKDVCPGFLQGSANAWFFLVAGFFFAGHSDEPGWWCRGIVKRLRTLIMPFFTINLLMLLLLLAYQGAHFLYPVSAVGSPPWKSFLCAMGCWQGKPIDSPTWFIRSLFFFVISTPVVFPLFRRLRIAAIVLAGLFFINVIGYDRVFACFGIQHIGEWVCSLYHPEFLFYFLAGVTFRIHNIAIASRRIAIFSFVIGVALSVCAPMDGLAGRNPIAYAIAYNCAKPLIIIGIVSLVSPKPWPKTLTRNSFAIYILHWQLILAAHIICEKTGTFNAIFGNPLWLCFCWIGIVWITIAVASLIRRSRFLETWVLDGR